MGVLVLGVIAAIAYGTLYPFQLHCPGSFSAAIAHFQPAWPFASGRGDIVANLVLYVPLGLAVIAWQAGRSAAWRVGLALAIGVGLSFSLELVQTCERARVASWSDVGLNTIGALVGAIGGVVVGRRLVPAMPALGRGDIGAALLLALFAAWRLAPYVPTIDWQKWKDALKPIVQWPLPPPLLVLRYAALWLVMARLVQAVLVLRRPALFFFLLFATYLGLRVLIVDLVILPAELLGIAIALAVTLAFGQRIPAPALAALLAVAILYQGLNPWRLALPAKSFCWIPFCGFLQGSLLINAISVAEKLFLYGSLVWLLVRGGFGHRVAGILTAVPLLVLEVAQTYLPGRVAEITDPLLALGAAEALRLIDRRPPVTARRR